MMPHEVAAALQAEPAVRKRFPNSPRREELFKERLLYARYDDGDRLIEVEFGDPGVVYYEGHWLGCPYRELLGWALRSDARTRFGASGFVAPTMRLMAYVDKPESFWDAEVADSVSVVAETVDLASRMANARLPPGAAP
jgi:hypothetical protein